MRALSAPLREVGVLDPYGETLLPDVDGLQQPSVPQLGRHVVHVKDPGMLTEDRRDKRRGFETDVLRC